MGEEARLPSPRPLRFGLKHRLGTGLSEPSGSGLTEPCGPGCCSHAHPLGNKPADLFSLLIAVRPRASTQVATYCTTMLDAGPCPLGNEASLNFSQSRKQAHHYGSHLAKGPCVEQPIQRAHVNALLLEVGKASHNLSLCPTEAIKFHHYQLVIDLEFGKTSL